MGQGERAGQVRVGETRQERMGQGKRGWDRVREGGTR